MVSYLCKNDFSKYKLVWGNEMFYHPRNAFLMALLLEAESESIKPCAKQSRTFSLIASRFKKTVQSTCIRQHKSVTGIWWNYMDFMLIEPCHEFHSYSNIVLSRILKINEYITRLSLCIMIWSSCILIYGYKYVEYPSWMQNAHQYTYFRKL